MLSGSGRSSRPGVWRHRRPTWCRYCAGKRPRTRTPPAGSSATSPPAAAEALPELTALRTSVEAVVRVNAARAVWRITGDLDALLAVLRADLNQHHALQALAELGPAGAALADLLPPMFDDDNEWRAACAATAYWHLTGDAAPVVPVLIRHIECVPRGMIAVRTLADVGPAAAAAIPLLRQAVDSPYRQAQWPATDTAIVEDEAWIQACGQALIRSRAHRRPRAPTHAPQPDDVAVVQAQPQTHPHRYPAEPLRRCGPRQPPRRVAA